MKKINDIEDVSTAVKFLESLSETGVKFAKEIGDMTGYESLKLANDILAAMKLDDNLN